MVNELEKRPDHEAGRDTCTVGRGTMHFASLMYPLGPSRTLEVDPDTAPEVEQKARSSIDAASEPDIAERSISTDNFPYLDGSLNDTAVVLAAKPHKTFAFDFVCVVVAVFLVAWCLPVLDQPINVSGAIEPTRSWCVTVPPTSQTKFTLLSKAATLEFERTTFLSVSLLWTVLLCATLPSPSWKIFCGAGRPLWFFQREISFRENPPLPTSERDTRHYPPWLNEHTAGLYGFFLFSQRSPLDQYCRSTLGCSAAPGLLLAADAPIGFQGFYATLAWSATDVKMLFLFRACLLATFLVFCFEEPGGPDFDRRVLRVEDFFFVFCLSPYRSRCTRASVWVV